MSWCELENGLVCKGGMRAKSEMHPSVSEQVQVSKCQYPSVSKQVQISKCKLASASISASTQMQVSKCKYPSVCEQNGFRPLSSQMWSETSVSDLFPPKCGLRPNFKTPFLQNAVSNLGPR